ncbi:synaptic vesicle glycoprotein 2B [Syngnathoides biaculeatus]|uniref:synaptic vesicle glycoprotein 2B n=1 Tax=Syngnathoides biaculeatus TaxID=300417 RepID=UPI002ADE2DB5|nr:synaptic vesicle glycoprotein 2B [Syngnathoides biaculeatus]
MPTVNSTSDEEPLLSGNRQLYNASDSEDEGDTLFERRTSNERDADEDARGRLTYEEAIEVAGFGPFHGLLLLVCGWANASDAVEIVGVSFLLPTARCDLLLSSSDMGLLTASIFLGMMAGGYLWGYMADRRGRCSVLVVSLTVNGVFGGLASAAQRFWLFLLLRFISGVGVGGSIPVIFSYFSEFIPRLRRGAMISALATFWMAGNILAAGLAWLVIPGSWAHFSLGPLDFQSWRVFVVLCSIPSITSAIIFKLFMPESPKFLTEAGRETEAIQVFRQMHRVNTLGKGTSFPEFSLHVNVKQREDKTQTRQACGRLGAVLKQGLMPVRLMFSGNLKSRSIVLLLIFYCISFSYYGLWMWFPELFARMEDGGSPCASNVSAATAQPNHSCYPVNTVVYEEGFFIAAANLPGNIFTILVMDTVGGRLLLSSSLLVSSLSVFLIYAVQTKTQSLVLSCLFSGVSVIAWNALDVVGTELYPTQLRSSALGVFTGAGRVAAIMGNVAFGSLVDSDCAVPVLLVSGLLLAGGVVALFLPRSKQTELA